jgi:hypothetical protein
MLPIGHALDGYLVLQLDLVADGVRSRGESLVHDTRRSLNDNRLVLTATLRPSYWTQPHIPKHATRVRLLPDLAMYFRDS